MLLYIAIGLMVVLTITASSIYYLAKYDEMSSVKIYQSEVITNLAEAAVEEIFFNVEEQLNNPGPTNKIYEEIRQPWDPGRRDYAIDISETYMRHVAKNAIVMAKELFNVTEEQFEIRGEISNVEPFEIKGFQPYDPIEKNGAFKVTCKITFEDLTKVVTVSRPIKVVRCTVPVLSECTLFVNNLDVPVFAQWPSVMGYDPEKPGEFEPQKSLVLDNGWRGYQKSNTREDFLKTFQEKVLPQGAVPPGRVFINHGIVPLTNGDRASGALQKTFFSAESELLPPQGGFDFKSLKEFLNKQYEESQRQTGGRANTARPEDPTVSADPTASTSPTAGTSNPADSLPDDGQLIMRHLGWGLELKEKELKEHVGKKVDGYKVWFDSLIKEWEKNNESQFDPANSGLDLYGWVIEKKKGQRFEGDGLWAKIVGVVKKITDAIMEKLYSKYKIYISPTLVYGEVLESFFMVMDYATTGWLDKMKNTFTMSANQFPLPYFPTDYWEGRPELEAISKIEELPSEWEEDIRKRWMKLPEVARRPAFYKELEKIVFSQGRHHYLLPPEYQAVLGRLPKGAMWRPYNQALLDFLFGEERQKNAEQPLVQLLEQTAQKGVYFFRNEVDLALPDNMYKGAFESFFNAPLTEFNPFLFYQKATDFIASIYDPRNPKENVFFRKYMDEKQKGLLDLKGVIYITGTEDLKLGGWKYKGKAVIITFGRVVFDGFFVKDDDWDNPDRPEQNALCTIISLGGVKFNTSERIDAQLYSYIYPFEAAQDAKINVFGSMGCNMLDLSKLPLGGTINFDWSYHIPEDQAAQIAGHYYHVSITDEIKKYEYVIKRELNLLGAGRERRDDAE